MSRKERESPPAPASLEILLVHARWKNAVMSAIAIGGAIFLGLRMGFYGYIAGGALVLALSGSIIGFVKTLLHPAGAISIREDELALPHGLCTGDPVVMPISDLRHAYILRRSVPWNQTAPVLVVETQRGVFEYPRDWFYSDQDARRVSIELNRRLGVLT